MPDLRPLLDRIEKAEGPDRELDLLIWVALVANPSKEYNWSDGVWFKDHGEKDRGPYWRACDHTKEAPFYTASLDAALALVERVRPGHWWSIEHVGGAPPAGFAKARIFTPEVAYSASGSTPALALLSALIRSLIEGDENE